jgi:hypothetical protein
MVSWETPNAVASWRKLSIRARRRTSSQTSGCKRRLRRLLYDGFTGGAARRGKCVGKDKGCGWIAAPPNVWNSRSRCPSGPPQACFNASNV